MESATARTKVFCFFFAKKTALLLSNRVPALDGLRGLLALYVAFYHATDTSQYAYWLQKLSHLAVAAFFVLSGWVLTRSWDGRYGVFLVRRFIRLWPTFALGMVVGIWVMHLALPPSRLLWYPMASPWSGAETDRPAWSLFVEAWAMPFMPLFVWASRRAVRAAGLAALIFWIGMAWDLQVLYGLLFLLGACLSNVTWRSRLLEAPAAQFLGRISYSLYLSHWLVIRAIGPYAAALAIIPVAWVVWKGVEEPSIRLSRKAGLLFEKKEAKNFCPLSLRQHG